MTTLQLISEKQILSEAKKLGVTNVSKTKIKAINKELLKTARECSRETQQGGTVLPSEYFGNESGSYHESVGFSDTSVSSTVIRPGLSWSGTGGASLFKISKAAVERALKELNKNKKTAFLVEKIRNLSSKRITKLLKA
jgi:hypothetical protein